MKNSANLVRVLATEKLTPDHNHEIPKENYTLNGEFLRTTQTLCI